MEKIIIKLPYIDRITVAQKIRPKYYHKTKYKPYNLQGKILGKRLSTTNYSWHESGFLINNTTNEKVISNPRKVGQVRTWVINFQKIYDGTIRMHIRNNYLNNLKELISPWLEDIPIITEFPLKIEFFIFSEEMRVDVSNKGVIYIKVFEDILQVLGKIPNDSSEYIRDTGRCVWIPTPKHKERMEFHISKIE